MKKIILMLLLFAGCKPAPESSGVDLKLEKATSECVMPSGVITNYDEEERTLEVFWDASASSPMHYMIQLDDEGYQFVDFVNQKDSDFPGRRFTFRDVASGTHAVCVRAVCIDDTQEDVIPSPSSAACVQLFLSTALQAKSF